MKQKSNRHTYTPKKPDDYFYQREQQIDKYLIKSHVKPECLSGPGHSLDYGTLNQFKLDDLINFQGDGFNEPKRIRLAFIQNNSIHLQEEAVQLFEKYVKHQISFISAYGKSKAGKSLMWDKLVNLCEFAGNYFSSQNHQEIGIYAWSVPLSKGNLKVFFMDIDGYSSECGNSYFMLLDFMMLLSSAVLLLAEPQDYAFDELAVIYKHISKSRSRFRSNSELADTFWPNNVYCLFRRAVSITKGLESIIKLFNEFNFVVVQDAMNPKQAQKIPKEALVTAELKKYGHNKKIIQQEYVKQISGTIRDVMFKIEAKSYLNLRFTGANLIKLTINTTHHLNLKDHLNVDKIFHKSMKELYIEAYNFHTQLYNETLIEYLSQEEPMELDYLLKAFQNCSDQILNSFNNLKVNPELKEIYTQKLEQYIAEKQKMVLEINKKKSKNKAKTAVPELPKKIEIGELKEFVAISKNAPKNYEQVFAEELVPSIAAGYKYIDKTFKDDDKELRQKSVQYQRKIEARSKELEQLQRNKNKKASEVTKTLTVKSNYEAKQKKLNEALKTLKTQYQVFVPDTASKKKDLKSSKSVQVLRAEEQALKREKQKKQRMIQELRSQSPIQNREIISHLQSKISEKVSQQRDLQNLLTSQMKVPTVQILKSTTSINSPRKVQSRVFDRANTNIRIIPSPKA